MIELPLGTFNWALKKTGSCSSDRVQYLCFFYFTQKRSRCKKNLLLLNSASLQISLYNQFEPITSSLSVPYVSMCFSFKSCLVLLIPIFLILLLPVIIWLFSVEKTKKTRPSVVDVGKRWPLVTSWLSSAPGELRLGWREAPLTWCFS